MTKIEEFKNYLLETQFKMTYFQNKLDLLNYSSIEHFDNNKIMIKYDQGLVVVDGKNLVIKRLIKDEILITGDIKSIELR
jgi:sporulation protein YqfC